MEKFYPVIDFHSHVVSPQELVRLCPDDQKTAFFRYIVPTIEKVAHFSEPVHYRFLRYLALNFNDRLSLLAWGYCGELGLMETLRLFKTYDFNRLLHMGWESWRSALALGQKYNNIMVETSWQPARTIRRGVDKLGAHRVLFGSDFPLFQQWQALKEVRKALSKSEFQQVTSLNAMRLLHMKSNLLSHRKIG